MVVGCVGQNGCGVSDLGKVLIIEIFSLLWPGQQAQFYSIVYIFIYFSVNIFDYPE